MFRRLGAALLGLALILPIFGAAAAPAAAHGSNAFTYEYVTITDGDGVQIVGALTNHTHARYTGIVVTATWRDGSTVMTTESAPIFMSNLAPHASSPFSLFEDDVEIDLQWELTLVAGGTTTPYRPVGGLEIEAGEFTATNTYEGTVTNEGPVTARQVVVYANRMDGAYYTGAGWSASIESLAPGASATYVIEFDERSFGDVVLNHIAKTHNGSFVTSWNNYFSDLGTTNFTDSIAWLADEGITTGCGPAIFCPHAGVSRAQMAVFLDRALDLPDAADQGFTDLANESPSFQQAINNLAAAGITSGCSTTPKEYCPNHIVTRGQMSAFIVRGYSFAGKDIEPIAGPGPFSDDDGHFSEPYNNAMYDAAITTGCGVGTYCPTHAVLRGQMAVFMQAASLLPDEPT